MSTFRSAGTRRACHRESGPASLYQHRFARWAVLKCAPGRHRVGWPLYGNVAVAMEEINARDRADKVFRAEVET